MAVHEILKMGDPRLLRIAPPVTEFDTDELHLLVADMFDTMAAADGAGLAAPQIGVDVQLVIFGTDEINPRYPDAPLIPRTVLLNPVITPLGDEVENGWEGCLSVPGLRGLVPRFSKIRYTGVDLYGDPIDRTVEGFHARVVQHECDHLIGKLYPMRPGLHAVRLHRSVVSRPRCRTRRLRPPCQSMIYTEASVAVQPMR
jgi:peptide deformylase